MDSGLIYSDPEKLRRLEDAIKLGFIVRSVDSNNTVTYTLTQGGQQQWGMERMMSMMGVKV